MTPNDALALFVCVVTLIAAFQVMRRSRPPARYIVQTYTLGQWDPSTDVNLHFNRIFRLNVNDVFAFPNASLESVKWERIMWQNEPMLEISMTFRIHP